MGASRRAFCGCGYAALGGRLAAGLCGAWIPRTHWYMTPWPGVALSASVSTAACWTLGPDGRWGKESADGG
jgi:hypothetical protein